MNDPHVGLAMLLLRRLAAPSAEHGPARHLLLGDRPGGRCLRPCIAAPRSAPGAPGGGCAQGPCTRWAARLSPASHVGGRPCSAPGPRLSGGAWGSLCSPHPQSPRPGLAERVTGAGGTGTARSRSRLHGRRLTQGSTAPAATAGPRNPPARPPEFLLLFRETRAPCLRHRTKPAGQGPD